MKNKILIATVLMFLIHRFSMAQGSWTQQLSLPDTGRFCAVAFSIGSKGYVSTGGQIMCQIKFKDLWEWDQATHTWSQRADLPAGKRAGATGFAIGTKGYIGLGENGIMYNDFWEWDQPTNTWIRKADFPGSPRGQAVGFSIGEKGYVGTGFLYYGDHPYFKDFWEWDQATDTWTQMADFGGGNRELAIGFSIGNKGYIGTGFDSSVLFNDFWEWDQSANTWTQKNSLPGEVRAAAVGFNFWNFGLVGSGSGNSGPLRDFWLYDPSSDSWEQMSNMNQTRVSGVGFAIGEKGYVATGYGYDWLHDLWQFETRLTGIDEPDSGNTISIFPNPCSSEAIIELNTLIHNATLKVYNSLGQEVRETKGFYGKSLKFERENLASGTYLITLSESKSVVASIKVTITD